MMEGQRETFSYNSQMFSDSEDDERDEDGIPPAAYKKLKIDEVATTTTAAEVRIMHFILCSKL